jgi:hypothetical protein
MPVAVCTPSAVPCNGTVLVLAGNRTVFWDSHAVPAVNILLNT